MSKQRKTSVRIEFGSEKIFSVVGQPLGYVHNFFHPACSGMSVAKAESLRYQ